jgi:hypothetical protein
MEVKASYGMGLKLAQTRGCPMPMLYEMSIQGHKVISHPFSKLADKKM